jgi:hypothetical protein
VATTAKTLCSTHEEIRTNASAAPDSLHAIHTRDEQLRRGASSSNGAKQMTYIRPKSYENLLTPFRLDTLQEIEAPEGCDGVWHRYVIVQGTNTIVGMRSGALSDVNHIVNGIVERLNLRFAKQQAKVAEKTPKKVALRPAP